MIGFILMALVGGTLLMQSLGLEQAVCEVCMEYRGNRQCRTVGAATEAEATQGAITNACTYLSGGVTDGMACGRQTPASIDCR